MSLFNWMNKRTNETVTPDIQKDNGQVQKPNIEEADNQGMKLSKGHHREKNSGEGNRKDAPDYQQYAIRRKPLNIMGEVQQLVISCSSPPIAGTPEENARRVMQKIQYFRENGVAEKDLYILEIRILQFMPDFVVKNFEEFYRFLKEDITPIYLIMEMYLAAGDFDAAKKIADPMAVYLEKHKQVMLDGRFCFQNGFETALYTLEKQQAISRQRTKDNYTAFLVAYARILQNTRSEQKNREGFQKEESKKYLKWAKELSPQNASVWLYLGVSYNNDEKRQLDCYEKALHYCYLKDGDYGLTKIYEMLALYYWSKNKMDMVTALKEIIALLGGDTRVLTFLLLKRPPESQKPFKEVLRQHNIQIGFSSFVQSAAEFLDDPELDTHFNQEIQKYIQDIRSVNMIVK